MVAAQLWYQGTADAQQLPALEFLIGSWASMKAQFFRTMHPLKKLADKFLGPYEVIAHPGTHSVMVTRQPLRHPPSVPCLDAGTRNPKHNPQPSTAAASTRLYRWQARV